MVYNVNKLTAKECDLATELATKRKDDFLFAQLSLKRTLKDKSAATAAATAKLASVTIEWKAKSETIDKYEEGDEKVRAIDDVRRLNDQKENLESRLAKGGNTLVLDTELDAGLLEVDITEIDKYLAAVAAHKATL